jgi:hypothetical protein
VSSSFALLSAAQDIQAALVQPKLLEALINQHFGKQPSRATIRARSACSPVLCRQLSRAHFSRAMADLQTSLSGPLDGKSSARDASAFAIAF